MKLWLLWQDINTGYDTYDSAVVAAETEEEARMVHPYEGVDWDGEDKYEWADASYVQVQLIGEAVEGTEKGVILASF